MLNVSGAISVSLGRLLSHVFCPFGGDLSSHWIEKYIDIVDNLMIFHFYLCLKWQ